jgi:putative intracellular protease/amidase
MPLEHRILALVFQDVEALDLFGPLGAIVPRSDYYTLQLVNVHKLPAPHGLECSIKNGIGVIPNLSIADVLESTEPFNTLFIPGGLSMIHLLDDPMLLKKIGHLVDRAPNVFTVCTGSLILAATGRLNGREATCNKRTFDELTPKCRSSEISLMIS